MWHLLCFLFFSINAEKETDESFLFEEIIQESVSNSKKIKLCDQFILKYPINKNIVEVQFIKIQTLYKAKEYAKALAALDVFLKFNDYKRKECLRMKFFCLYNSVKHYMRDYDLLEKTIEAGDVFAKTIDLYDDKKFEEAYEDSKIRIAYYYYILMKNALESKDYIAMLINANILLNEYKETEYAQEANFRVIEYLLNQNSVYFKDDILEIYFNMKDTSCYNKWILEVEKLLKKFNISCHEVLNIRLQKNELSDF